MQIPTHDENLWFTMGDCCPGKHFLLHNAHTFLGRIAAWCPQKQVRFFVSRISIEDCSTEAAYWLKGFLSGCEPDAPRDETGDYLPDDDPRMETWRAAIQQFPETGIWIEGRTCESCGAELLPTQPGFVCQNCHEEVVY
jgi:hypothetical protein